MQPILYARLGWGEILTPIVVMFISLNLFSLYPGLDAARMQPSQALAPR
jgi:ABC-type lipoprotein release transport system permease subunit